MKKTLLAAVAVAALIAGPAIAQRQEAPASDVKGSAQPPAAIQKAPAEKIAPAGKVAPSGRTSGDTDIKARSGADTRTPAAAETKTSSDKSGDKPGMSADTKAQSQANTRASGNSTALSTDQKAKIRTTVLTANAPRVSSVNFSINIGTVVPRTLRLVTVPAPLVEIHPAWRGYMYFVHGDTIIIVEPGTLRIVAVVDV